MRRNSASVATDSEQTFKIKVHSKGNKQVVKSHINDKQLKTKKKALVKQIKRIKHPKKNQAEEIWLYNKMVTGMQNYYQIATHISLDMNKLNRAIMTVIINRIKGINKKGRRLTPNERKRYGKSKMLRYLADEPIYPISYVRHKISKNMSGKSPTEIVNEIKLKLLRQQLYDRSIEYADNRISLYFAQKGRYAVTGEKFVSAEEIHCHHKIPKSKDGMDDYQNLILVTATVHKLIHATNALKQFDNTCKPVSPTSKSSMC